MAFNASAILNRFQHRKWCLQVCKGLYMCLQTCKGVSVCYSPSAICTPASGDQPLVVPLKLFQRILNHPRRSAIGWGDQQLVEAISNWLRPSAIGCAIGTVSAHPEPPQAISNWLRPSVNVFQHRKWCLQIAKAYTWFCKRANVFQAISNWLCNLNYPPQNNEP